MASSDALIDPTHSHQSGMRMQDLLAELHFEICSYLEVHDQLAMRKVCKSWRSNLFPVLLSKYVDLDTAKMPKKPETPEQFNSSPHSPYTAAGILNPLWIQDQQGQRDHSKYDAYFEEREHLLEQALQTHVQPNTEVLVLRHVTFERLQMDIVVRVIKEKETNLIQLILKDCQVQERYLISPHCSFNVQGFNNARVFDLLPATRKLILDNYTLRSALDSVKFDPEMPCPIPIARRVGSGYMSKKLPIVLPRYEFDCSQPLLHHYRSFVLAVNSACPEVTPEVRNEVVQLYKSWIDTDAQEDQWRALGNVIKYLKGVPVDKQDAAVDTAAVRQLDPLTLNKLTLEALHRLYCLPPDIRPLPFGNMSIFSY